MWDLLEPLGSMCPSLQMHTKNHIHSSQFGGSLQKRACRCRQHEQMWSRETERCQVPGAQLINMTKLSPKPSALRPPTRGPSQYKEPVLGSPHIQLPPTLLSFAAVFVSIFSPALDDIASSLISQAKCTADECQSSSFFFFF